MLRPLVTPWLVPALMVAVGAPWAPSQSSQWAQARHVEAMVRPVMVCDIARQRLVRFGSPGLSQLGQVWEWAGSGWHEARVGSLSVSRRPAAVYDRERVRTVLFSSQTHEWDGGGWRRRAVADPPRRADHAMAYDTQRGRTVSFGGQYTVFGYVSSTTTVRADTWEFDGTRWLDVAVAERPPARSHHVMAYDAARGVTVLFGGVRDASAATPQLLADTWEWDGSSWIERSPVTRPAPTDQAAMAYDFARDRCVLVAPDGTWEWDGTDWTAVATGPADARTDAALAYDERTGRVVRFGGLRDLAGVSVSDTATWAFDGAAWIPLDAGVPPSRVGGELAEDAAGQRLLMFGGSSDDALWAWDGAAWQELAARGPSARFGHAWVPVEASGEMLLFGGFEQSGPVVVGDTWTFDGATWTARSASTAPPPRWDPAAAYDAGRQRAVLFGGQGQGGGLMDDTWEWDGNAWLRQLPATSPPPRRHAAMAFDRLRGRAVLFGGDRGAPSSEFDDTWEWDGATWSQRTTATTPPRRTDHQMYYDPTRQQVLLYGGSRSGASIGGLWEFDGIDWTQVSSTGSAPTRGLALAYHRARGEVVTFGGWGAGQATWRYGDVVPAGTASFRFGCAGSEGTPVLTTFGWPVLGTTQFAVDLVRARPSAPAAFLVGGSAAQLSLGAGSPCVLWVQPGETFAVPVMTTASGFASLPLPVPASAPAGTVLRVQGAVIDAVAPGLGIATTAATVVAVGH
ncbi:MAG: kelch repeat-containing protein [Planctomycetota bacterium]